MLAVIIAEEAYKVFYELGLKDFSVLYFDMEMREDQYQMRYEDPKTEKSREFPEALIRVNCSHRDILLTEDNMLKHFADAIIDKKARVVIIDDFTCLCKGEKASTAALFMQNLKLLRDRNRISVLVVAHSYRKNDFKPITIADLKGSSYMSASAGSIFAINFSRKGDDVRYVKQLKSRDSHIEYGADNVLEFKIKRGKDGALELDLQGTTTEEEQIEIDYMARDEIEDKIRKLKAKGWSIRRIAKKLKISPAKVYRCINPKKPH